LQDLLTQTARHSHALHEWLHDDVVPALAELHELSRSRRRHSAYPKVLAVHNALEGLSVSADELRNNGEALLEWLGAIVENVQRRQES
jgi:hypothetical protein